MFRVIDTSDFPSIKPEVKGSKQKEWLGPIEGVGTGKLNCLYKIGRPGTGENWSERAACEVAKLLDLPSAAYELAVRGNTSGVLSEQVMPNGGSLAPGSAFLAVFEDDYDLTKRFKHSQYKLTTVANMLASVEEIVAPNGAVWPLETPLTYFIGYLLFDVLIGNTDRHHDNWGVVVERTAGGLSSFRSSLAATFDHASSLGRILTDEKRRIRLSGRDARATIATYCARAQTAFYNDDNVPRLMSSYEVLSWTAQHHPEALRLWGARICDISRNQFMGIFSRFPPGWISDTAAEFAVELLCCNQRVIDRAMNG